MTKRILAAAAVLSCTVLPLAAYAQTSGVAAGATTGAVGGAIVGGPIGAVVGGVGGAIIGGLSDEQRPRFREYAVQQRRPSYRYQDEVRVGAVLPSSGVQYYEAPPEYAVHLASVKIRNTRQSNRSGPFGDVGCLG